MRIESTDLELIESIKNSKDEKSLTTLIERHSGIYIDMVRRFGIKSLSFDDFNDIIDEKEYNIYKAALDYDENKSKFSTYLATKVKLICLSKRSKANKNKEKINYEEVDFLFCDKDNNPY